MHTKTVNGRTTAWGGSYDVHVKSNYRTRPLVSFAELPADAWDDFGYMLPDNLTRDDVVTAYMAGTLDNSWLIASLETPRFFQFRGSWYDSQEFERSPDNFQALGWDAWQTESYFSAVLLRWFDAEGYELESGVVVGYAHW